MRYTDEIQCAAARVVAAVRQRARARDPARNAAGLYDAFHVRRGDFQYRATRVAAADLLAMARRKISPGATVYMATDERDKGFFEPLREHYDLVFLDDFHDQALVGINSNFYGMIDQLVTTRSRVFFGCWFSTYVLLILLLFGCRRVEFTKLASFADYTSSLFYCQIHWLHQSNTRIPCRRGTATGIQGWNTQ